MINFGKVKNYCNEDISLIENYDKAIADSTQMWQCHHRRELETPRKKLIEIGEYFNRPAEELIFLTPYEHNSLHKKHNKNMLGKHHSEEHKQKISEAIKAKSLGRHWFNNGIKSVFVKECPEGFVKGRINLKKYEKRQ